MADELLDGGYRHIGGKQVVGEAVAVRTLEGEQDTLHWVLADHLGSTNVTANADGSWNSQIQYTAFGETRTKNGVTPSDYRYTGQLSQMDEIGLQYYVARWYDPALAHFAQADIVVPDPGNAVTYDRFSYARGNPILYNDPDGHDVGCTGAGGNANQCLTNSSYKFTPYPNVANPPIATKYLYTTTGWGTGLSSEATTYYGVKPLAPVADKFVQIGGKVENIIWNGFIGKGNPTKEDAGNKIFNQLKEVIQKDPEAEIFMVGHSAGTDAMIYALFLLYEENPEWVNNIKRVAILVVDLADKEDPGTSSREITDAIGESVNNMFGEKMYYARSSSYANVDFPGDDSNVHNFFQLDHEGLAVDSQIMSEIIGYFGW